MEELGESESGKFIPPLPLLSDSSKPMSSTAPMTTTMNVHPLGQRLKGRGSSPQDVVEEGTAGMPKIEQVDDQVKYQRVHGGSYLDAGRCGAGGGMWFVA